MEALEAGIRDCRTAGEAAMTESRAATHTAQKALTEAAQVCGRFWRYVYDFLWYNTYHMYYTHFEQSSFSSGVIQLFKMVKTRCPGKEDKDFVFMYIYIIK